MEEDLKTKISDLIIAELESNKSIDSSLAWANKYNFQHNIVVGVIKSLTYRKIGHSEQFTSVQHELTEEGIQTFEKGSPEARLWEFLGDRRVSLDECQKVLGKDITKIGMSQGMKRKWFKVTKEGKTQLIERLSTTIVDEARLLCTKVKNLEEIDKKDISTLSHRNMVKTLNIVQYKVTKGECFDDRNTVYEKDFTQEMIEKGTWKDSKFSEYNFNSLGILPEYGSLHPLLKVKEEIANSFIELGFEEMPTNKYVESSFWNFDALFQPQQHPTRDLHDTFFVKDPKYTNDIPEDYMARVKSFHESGGDSDSIGYRSKWEEIEARKNILRTHTTAVSARMLYQLAEEYKKTGVFTPKKYFSIDRVFRNESTDATHLAEFYQVEGLIADKGLTLNNLIATLQAFFVKIGIKDLKFKPAYNPYTEPSLEVFSYHEGLGKLIEIGNSGVFRPEMLLPMGFPEDVRVVAWGLSLERPTMIKYGISAIRDLCGHRVKLNFVKTNPICRFD